MLSGESAGSTAEKSSKSITGWFIRKYTTQTAVEATVVDPDVRTQYAYLEAWVSIIGNLVLSVVKIALGLLLNSISLLADAAHTVADVLTSIVILIGFRMAKTPADEKHPHGHGRVEFLSTLLIAVLLMIVGGQFGWSSYQRLVDGTPVKGSALVAVIMLVGAAFKEWMTRFAVYLGTKASAQALIADAWHHRTDAVASVLVAIAIIASGYGYYWVDALLGMGVSALIIYTGLSLAMTASSSLIGEQAPESLVAHISETVLNCQGVKGMHKVMVHDYGGRKAVSLHIQVNDDLSLVESHRIASDVEEAVRSRLPADIVVHVEPESEGSAS
jgi:cation diffusion facilitator family transporter